MAFPGTLEKGGPALAGPGVGPVSGPPRPAPPAMPQAQPGPASGPSRPAPGPAADLREHPTGPGHDRAGPDHDEVHERPWMRRARARAARAGYTASPGQLDILDRLALRMYEAEREAAAPAEATHRLDLPKYIWALLGVIALLLLVVIVVPIMLSSRDIIHWAGDGGSGLGLDPGWDVLAFVALDAAAFVCVFVTLVCTLLRHSAGPFPVLVWVFALGSAYANYEYGSRPNAPGSAWWFFPAMSIAGPFLLEAGLWIIRRILSKNAGERHTGKPAFGLVRWIPGHGAFKETYGAARVARLEGLSTPQEAVARYRELCPDGGWGVLAAMQRETMLLQILRYEKMRDAVDAELAAAEAAQLAAERAAQAEAARLAAETDAIRITAQAQLERERRDTDLERERLELETRLAEQRHERELADAAARRAAAEAEAAAAAAAVDRADRARLRAEQDRVKADRAPDTATAAPKMLPGDLDDLRSLAAMPKFTAKAPTRNEITDTLGCGNGKGSRLRAIIEHAAKWPVPGAEPTAEETE